MTDYDKVCRRMAKYWPLGLLQLLITSFSEHFRYHGWVDARTISWPGDPERTGDAVALLEARSEPGPLWAFDMEFQTEPDPDMFGRLLIFLGLIWMEKRPDALPGSRYHLGATVVNLTGTSASLPASYDMPMPGPDGLRCCLKVREVYLKEWSAEGILAVIVSGQIDPIVLVWLPLMQTVDVGEIQSQWLETWKKQPDEEFRRDLASMARTLANLSEHREQWLKTLEGLGVQKSPFMESLRQEGRREGEQRARLELLQEQL